MTVTPSRTCISCGYLRDAPGHRQDCVDGTPASSAWFEHWPSGAHVIDCNTSLPEVSSTALPRLSYLVNMPIVEGRCLGLALLAPVRGWQWLRSRGEITGE